ncbi:hypothetical protein SCP_0116720 [Sparassis crispa]|uniref:Uncharacterized protein n=1 Tax=Sparassis crispa TaxID=139825 RepID=A0A401G9F7_9APHY|nr:hypothetical protein SCP_0116720 [Sparassis crispa]GBE78779.1 hypothetical protein SCP_0116720 [Sparassis crispa]
MDTSRSLRYELDMMPGYWSSGIMEKSPKSVLNHETCLQAHLVTLSQEYQVQAARHTPHAFRLHA